MASVCQTYDYSSQCKQTAETGYRYCCCGLFSAITCAVSVASMPVFSCAVADCKSATWKDRRKNPDMHGVEGWVMLDEIIAGRNNFQPTLTKI